MLQDTLLSLAQTQQSRDFVVHNGSVRNIARRFIPGETLEEAIQATRVLNRRGIQTAIALLGEHVEDEEGARQHTRSYMRAIDAIVQSGVEANLSCKPTSLGLNISQELCESNFRMLLEYGQAASIFVSVDMESSSFAARTIDVTSNLHKQFDHVGTVVQAYLHRSAADLDRLIAEGVRTRLVKGSYKEPASTAILNKSEIDHYYIQFMLKLLAQGNYPALATHDEAIIHMACNFVREHGISKTAFEFQMLYGIRYDLQEKLADQGYTVRVYLPFGTHWYPYLMRRMAEYPANLMAYMHREQ